MSIYRYKCERILTKVCCVCRAFEKSNLMTSPQTYTPQMSPGLKNEVEQHSSNQEKETAFSHNLEGIEAALPPSFTSLLTNCYAEVYQGDRLFQLNWRNSSDSTWWPNFLWLKSIGAAQSNDCEEVDLKSQIVVSFWIFSLLLLTDVFDNQKNKW